ncbi:MAG TPA: hypothetical protein VN222_03395, partial [Novosphingobium sp.]|nr:hypothetical protein [Novosphingobium sp.]
MSQNSLWGARQSGFLKPDDVDKTMRRKRSLDLALVDIAGLDLPASGECLIYDAVVPDLMLRLRDTGARTWIIRTRQRESRLKQTLGDALTLPVLHARRLAQTSDDGSDCPAPPP